jgi:hypothetical protein
MLGLMGTFTIPAVIKLFLINIKSSKNMFNIIIDHFASKLGGAVCLSSVQKKKIQFSFYDKF